MVQIALATSVATLALAGAIAGFFYAYSISVIWGLDATDPASAIRAMQGINIRVRNAAFFPVFFGMPVAALLAAGFWLMAGQRFPAMLLAAAALVYLAGAFLPTVWANVPMNEALARVAAPADVEAARGIWSAYSGPWLGWNHLRTAASIAALVLSGWALYAAGRAAPAG